MVDFIMNGILWVLALYGLIEIMKTIARAIIKVDFKNDGIFAIIAVKNQEEKIEGFMRSFLFRLIYGKEEYLKDIYIVDLNSTDNTKKILDKLEDEYTQIKVYDLQTCKQMLEKKAWKHLQRYFVVIY